MTQKSPLKERSFAFSVRIVKLGRYLQDVHNEYILSKQVLRSGTAVGALVREAEFAQSKSDFINKLSIALKEANETDYWIELLYETEYLDGKMFQSIQPDIKALIKMLVKSIKTSKNENGSGKAAS
ncbi:four helix bundle protein [Hydrogenimonas sp. SS33]|uniref:four helix bundle protein n=1 Tax=Hydrogenimonas leucolamina TaxID=2954236 RepID=UPI00336C0C39